jgi:superfamily II DNA or RNA helicase
MSTTKAIQLRDYQTKGTKMLNQAIRQGFKRILWVYSTGAGKSSVSSAYVKKCVENGKKVLFFVHSKELVVQFAQRLYHQFGIRSGIIMSKVEPARHLPVQVASIQTLVRRKYPPADIIFIDEAHRAKANTYQKVLEQYPNAIVVGLTATPFRGDGKGLGDIFETIVHPIKIRELIAKKYLVPTQVFTSDSTPDMSDVNTVRGDYDQKQMLQKFQEGTVITGVVQNYLRNANGKKAIVFNINVEHSKTMNRLFSMKLELLLLTWMERQIKPLDKR